MRTGCSTNRIAVLLGLTLIIVRRIVGTTGFVVIPRRWIVETTLAWLGRWSLQAGAAGDLPKVIGEIKFRHFSQGPDAV
jgi:transposase